MSRLISFEEEFSNPVCSGAPIAHAACLVGGVARPRDAVVAGPWRHGTRDGHRCACRPGRRRRAAPAMTGLVGAGR
jgi:hypothetical protein